MKIWVALLNGPWLKSLIDIASNSALLLNFMNVAFIKSKENYQNVVVTLKCVRGGPLGPMISFFASPVKTRKDFSALFLVIG